MTFQKEEENINNRKKTRFFKGNLFARAKVGHFSYTGMDKLQFLYTHETKVDMKIWFKEEINKDAISQSAQINKTSTFVTPTTSTSATLAIVKAPT